MCITYVECSRSIELLVIEYLKLLLYNFVIIQRYLMIIYYARWPGNKFVRIFIELSLETVPKCRCCYVVSTTNKK